jgi:hypothetical protein
MRVLMRINIYCWFFTIWFGVLFSNNDAVAQLTVSMRVPTPHSYNATQINIIDITFDREISSQNLSNSVFVHGSIQGRIVGSLTISPNNNRMIRFVPSNGYLSGERITVTLSTDLRASDGSRLNAPQSWSFNVNVPGGSLAFVKKLVYTLRMGSEPSKIIPVDINKDGAADLVVINSNNNLITIFENRFSTTGSLVLAREIELPPAPSKVAFEQDLPALAAVIAADLNNNGRPDVVILSPKDNRIAILRNNTGTINGMSVDLFSTGERPVSVATGDYNGDGFLDLAVASLGNDRVYIHLNNKSGAFQQPQIIQVGKTPSTILATDINGDNTTDLVVLSTGDRRIEVLENNGNASFTNRVALSNLGFIPTFMMVAPIRINNGNRLPDLLLGVSDQTLVRLYENMGNTFRLVGNRPLSNSSRPTDGTTADLDNDGIPELITSHLVSSDVNIARMMGDGLSGSVAKLDIDPIPQPSGLAVADLNRSGSMDIAVANAGVGSITVYLSASGGDCISIIGGLQTPSRIDFGSVKKGELVKREFTINNNSNRNFDIQLDIRTGSSFNITTNRILSLAPGAVRNNEVAFQAENSGIYKDEILVTLSSVCGVSQRTIELTAEIEVDKPDLEAFQLNRISLASDYIIGTTHQFEGVLRLNGEVPVTDPFKITFLLNNVEVFSQNVANFIFPGEQRAFQVTFRLEQPGLNTLAFVVDSDNVIAESNETNNRQTINIIAREGIFSVSPNPFTPNNDGYNDAVVFNYSQLFNVNSPRVTIFNFEGQVIRSFSVSDLVNGLIVWDGRDANGRLLKPGVYLYTAFSDGKLLSRGSITLAL